MAASINGVSLTVYDITDKKMNPTLLSFGFHVRNQKGEKLIGGSCRGKSYEDAANWVLSHSRFTCSGGYFSPAIWLNRKGLEPVRVYLYLSIDADKHQKGIDAQKKYRADKAAEDLKREEGYESDVEEGLALLAEKRRTESK